MSDFDDDRWMARALVLAERGIGYTDPNPTVGCVIVQGDTVVGEGTTDRAGGPHAEIVALAAAGTRAAGATVYVTLEPCAHQGRTGPCTQALIAARVGRVVAAGLDPNPRVCGKGIAELERAGVSVEHGRLEATARAVNQGYFSRLTRGRPFVRVKLAASLDGKTALASGASQWITGAPARADVHRWRARSSAVLTGIGTVLADDPQLSARPPEPARFVAPVKVVVDAKLRTPPTAQLLDSDGDVIICHTGSAVSDHPLERRGARLEPLPGDTRVDLAALLARLAALELNTVWVEAGATLSGALLEAGLVDELIVYLAPDLLGDGARGMATFGPLESLADRLALTFTDVRRLGRDLRITAVPSSFAER